jgi:hypothetical protein
MLCQAWISRQRMRDVPFPQFGLVPWITLLRMRERWPELRFEMKAGYLQQV